MTNNVKYFLNETDSNGKSGQFRISKEERWNPVRLPERAKKKREKPHRETEGKLRQWWRATVTEEKGRFWPSGGLPAFNTSPRDGDDPVGAGVVVLILATAWLTLCPPGWAFFFFLYDSQPLRCDRVAQAKQIEGQRKACCQSCYHFREDEDWEIRFEFNQKQEVWDDVDGVSRSTSH